MRYHCRLFWGTTIVAALLTGCSHSPAEDAAAAAERAAASHDKGASEAAAAIGAGTLKLKEYPPLPYPPGHLEYVELLRQRGVEYEVPQLPAGVAEADFIQEVRGWNDPMNEAIKQKFGADFFQELHAEAAKQQGRKATPEARQ